MFPSRRITLGGDVFRDEHSLTFDGTDDYIQLGEKFENNLFTVSAWIKMAAVDTETQAIFSNRGSADEGYMCYLSSGERASIKFEGQNCIGGTVLLIDTWYHLVWTYDDANLKVYVNAVLDSSATNPFAYTGSDIAGTANATIGMGSYGTSQYPWNGKISEVAIYNSALTASQVKTLYNGREPYNHKEGIASSSLESWYRMGDGKFDIISTLGVDDSDTKTFAVTDEASPSFSSELYNASNALGNLNNGNSITGLLIVEGGSTVTSGTAQIDDGGGVGRKSIHIEVSADTDRVVEDLNDYCTLGKAYRLSCIAKHGGSGDTAAVRLGSNTAISSNVTLVETLTTGHTSFAYFGINFIHTANTRYFGCREIGGNHNQEFWIERLSIQEYGGNSGVMINMTILKFTGDTP